MGGGITRTFRPWTHTSDDSYIYPLSLVVATATVSFKGSGRNGGDDEVAPLRIPPRRTSFIRMKALTEEREKIISYYSPPRRIPFIRTKALTEERENISYLQYYGKK